MIGLSRHANFWVVGILGLVVALCSNRQEARARGNLEPVWIDLEVPRGLARLFGGLGSSLAWVDLIFAYADEALESDPVSAEALMPRLLLATHLDPQWGVPSQFAVLALAVCPGSVAYESFREIVDSGLGRNPQEWRTRLFLSEHMDKCGVPPFELRHVVAPLASCENCPPWVRTYPEGFLGASIPPTVRVSMLLEARKMSFSLSDKRRIDARILKLIQTRRASDAPDVAGLVHLLLEAMDAPSDSAQGNFAERMILGLADSVLDEGHLRAMKAWSTQGG